jgi:predicted ArsR family transcriptional regulator
MNAPQGGAPPATLQVFGERQRALLQLLHRNKAGQTADEIADQLGITRTAVRQHLAALERDGYVGRRREARKTAGRPGLLYELSAPGRELFPRKYSWFSSLLLRSMRDQQGETGLSDHLREIAAHLAAEVATDPALEPDERIEILAKLMNELGYDAQSGRDPAGNAEVRAWNCIYHHLAEEFPALCDFDIALIGGITGRQVEHVECMVRGGSCCRFRLTADESRSAGRLVASSAT